MFIVFEDRPSDSPIVESIWRSHSERAGEFHSMAACHWGMVVSRHQGKLSLTVRGPETLATLADCPADGEWVGVQFKLGTFMPLLPADLLRNRNDVTLPDASGRTFYLNGSAWEYPDFENIDTFIERLLKQGLIVSDPWVTASLAGQDQALSPRTAQRHFLRATGMTQGTIRQIERARQATRLLQDGVAILQVVDVLGYSDQAHLTRSLKHFVGQTPAQLARKEAQLSLLFNTAEG